MTLWLPAVLAGSAAAVVAAAPRPAQARLTSMTRPAPPTDRWRALFVVAPLLVLVVAGVAAAVLAAAAAEVLRRAVIAGRTARDVTGERTCALDALSVLAAELRAGRTDAEALGAAADIATGRSGRAFADAAAMARLGGDVPASLRSDDSAVAAGLRALGACWQVCGDVGSGLAAAVERLEEGLRAAEAQRRAVTAELAGPRATAQLLAVLPLGGIGLAAALGAHPLNVLLHTPVGWACLGSGSLLDAAGVLWTRRLARTALP